MRLHAVRVLDANGIPNNTFDIRRPIEVELEYSTLQPGPAFRVALRLLTEDGIVVFTSSDQNSTWFTAGERMPGHYFTRCCIPGNLLNTGNYLVTVSSDVPFVETGFFEEHVLGFHVEQTGGVSGLYTEKWPGLVCPELAWSRQRAARSR